MSRRNKIIYGGLCFILCIFWGAGNPIIKIGLFSMTIFTMLSMRFILASIIFLVLFRGKIFKTVNRQNAKGLIIIGVLSAVTYIASNAALDLTEATISGFLMGIAVIFTPFLSYFMLKIKTDKRIYPIIAVVIVGIYFLCGGGGEFSFGLGELLALSSSATMALVMIYTSRYIEELGPIAISSVQSIIIALITTAIALIIEMPFDFGAVTTAGWASLLYQAIFCSVVTYLIQNVALQNLTPVFVSIVLCLEPLFTSIFSILMLDEILTVLGYIGGGLIFIGLILASLIEERSTEEL